MAIFDFSSDVNNVDFTKLGFWQAVSCPTGVPQVPAVVEPVGSCNETTIYNYNGTCYQCVLIQNASPTKVMLNNVIRWAKMTLYFDENTGSSVSNKTVYYKRPYGTLPNTSKTGYTFNGWFTDETWGTEVTEATTCNQVDNHTLYAKLDINYYTITFKNYVGSVIDTQSVPYGSTPSIPTGTPDNAQYDYSWPSVSAATANVTYQETRTVKSYVVTWYKYGKTGEDYAKRETLTYNSVSTAPSGTGDTTQYNYSWPQSSVTVTGTVNITETRALQKYTVTWENWDNSILKTDLVDYGGNGTPPPFNPTRTGYDFVSWVGTYTNVTSNRTITAKYDIKTYTVTWKDWNGTTLKTESVDYGGNGTPPTQPTRTGYTFNSWSGTYTNITSSRTITATYTINYYTVTFKDYNGTTLKTQSVAYGSNATPPADPTRTGYIFDGWNGSYTNITSSKTLLATYVLAAPTSWASTTSTSYMDTIEINVNYSLGIYNTSYTGCATTQNILGFLPSPSSYDFDDIVRIRVNSTNNPPKDLTFTCNTWRYYKAV